MPAQPPPQSPPPIVRLDPATMPEYFKGMPSYQQNGTKLLVIGLDVKGDAPLLETIKTKLAAEGWESGTVTPPGRPIQLSVQTRDKRLEDVFTLYKRLHNGDFGSVEVAPALVPDTRPQ